MDISSTTPSEESDSEESDSEESDDDESDTVLFLIHFIISRSLHLLHHPIKVIP